MWFFKSIFASSLDGWAILVSWIIAVSQTVVVVTSVEEIPRRMLCMGTEKVKLSVPMHTLEVRIP